MLRILPLLLALLATPALAQPDPGLLAALRQGGLVVFLRHTDTGPPNPDQAQAVIGDCATQRNLTERGRDQARAIGAAIRDLGIPVGRVLASPFCRATETGLLAFGAAEPDFALTLPRHVDDPARAAMGRALLALIAEAAPRPGESNLVLVGHSYHLIHAGGPRPDPQGAAAVLQPDGRGGFRTLGLIPPDGWPALGAARLALAE